jgi:hypothetical protein
MEKIFLASPRDLKEERTIDAGDADYLVTATATCSCCAAMSGRQS